MKVHSVLMPLLKNSEL